MRHLIRTKEGEQEIEWTPLQAIKWHCWECFGWDGNPAECTSPLCPLYPKRGRPKGWRGAGRQLSDSEKLTATKRLAVARKKRLSQASDQ